ncbi:MAG: Sec-independent protein translocase subunit TatA [Jiangellaceae bacterium]|nr:Sec-independent protein translocase subunit TatA [Jiangellaceae bacterium]
MFGRGIGPPEIILILLIILLLFGAKKLPDLARGVGRSLRIFKAETKGLKDDDHATASRDAEPPRAVEAGREDVESSSTAIDATVVEPADTPRRDA